MGHFRLAFCICSKTSFRAKLTFYENDFDLRENGLTDETRVHNIGFERRLVLIQGQRAT